MKLSLFRRAGYLLALSLIICILLVLLPIELKGADTAGLMAGHARADITDYDAGPVNDPSYVKALVLRKGSTTAVLITVDAVAIGGIGRINDDYLQRVRGELRTELGIAPVSILVNASHCHSVVRNDTAELTISTVKQALSSMQPVKVGVGVGQDNGLSENRRLKLKDGSEVDMRRAYSLPPDDQVASVGPIDPEIGIVRIDRMDGRPYAVIYNFACHPIMGAASQGNTAGFPGYASRLLEDAMGRDSMALFVQGCAGDLNPINYKQTSHPRDGEHLGNRLGATVLRAWREIVPQDDGDLRIVNQIVDLPFASDYAERLNTLEQQRMELVNALRPTDINLKSFLPLWIQHRAQPDTPSAHLQTYMHQQGLGRDDQIKFDEVNRKQLDDYLHNIETMEAITRLNVNRDLLIKNQAWVEARGNSPIPAELVGLRIGEFRLIAFPGELTVSIGLDLKKRSPHKLTFVAGYSNGYYFYLPNGEQRANPGFAQEDCDCIVAPGWQAGFETAALEVLQVLEE